MLVPVMTASEPALPAYVSKEAAEHADALLAGRRMSRSTQHVLRAWRNGDPDLSCDTLTFPDLNTDELELRDNLEHVEWLLEHGRTPPMLFTRLDTFRADLELTLSTLR